MSFLISMRRSSGGLEYAHLAIETARSARKKSSSSTPPAARLFSPSSPRQKRGAVLSDLCQVMAPESDESLLTSMLATWRFH
jgi:hypothetical protein